MRRVAEHLADYELSVGDFVLSGGELAAAMVVDAVARLLPGVLGDEDLRGTKVSARRMKDFWIVRSTPGRRNSAAGKCPTCCWAGIMRRSSGGAGLPHARKHSGFDPI